MTNALSELYKHNLWANLRLLDVCAPRDEPRLDATVPGTRGSIRDTFLHLVAAEGRYVALLSGTQPDPSLNERAGFPGWEALRERARQSGEALIAIAEDFDAARVLRDTRGGEAYAIPAVVPMLQAINHGTEHRTHIATILTQQGVEPPTLDGWQYGEERLGAQ
ncbi:MAG TPA: DinB family protein [Herpetosiphonaceae bacterium]|nr:DinB family protein [Herpetosiphonaceae bacterium]